MFSRLPESGFRCRRGRTVRTSPSGSESLSSTDRMVVRPGRTPNGVGLGRRRPVGFGAVRQDGLLDCCPRSPVRRRRTGSCGGMTSSQLLTSCMFWFTSHTLPGIHVVEDHQVPVHPEHIARRRAGLGHVHGLVIGIVGAVPDILVRPRPRRMHAPAQLHRSRRHPLPAERHRPRRRTIQRLRAATPSASRPPPHPRAGPDSCSFASRASATATSRPPGRNNFPRPASRPPAHPPPPPAAGPRRPSARPRCWTSRRCAAPSASTAVTVTCPDFGSTL